MTPHPKKTLEWITDPDSAVFAFEATSATLLKLCRVDPKPGVLTAERNFRLVVRN